jgi:predicted dehydrogenase
MFNVGVIGLGMGRDHLMQYKDVPDVRILGIADVDEKRLESCRAEFSVPHAFSDYRKLLKLADLDAVSVALPNNLHASVTIEALEAGRHVLVEKPMAMNAAEARRMIEAAGRTGKHLALAMNYRWNIREAGYLRQVIAAGTLGEIYSVRSVSTRRRTFPRGHKIWFSDRSRSGGGALIDMGPHILDLAMWFAGDWEPVSVSGVARTAIMTDTDIDDYACGLVRMKGGCTISIESTWASHTRPGLSVTVLGTKGGAVLDMSSSQVLTFFGEDGATLTESKPTEIVLSPDMEPRVQAHFVDCIRTGKAAENTPARGLAVMQIIEGIYRSSADGREVRIS